MERVLIATTADDTAPPPALAPSASLAPQSLCVDLVWMSAGEQETTEAQVGDLPRTQNLLSEEKTRVQRIRAIYRLRDKNVRKGL